MPRLFWPWCISGSAGMQQQEWESEQAGTLPVVQHCFQTTLHSATRLCHRAPGHRLSRQLISQEPPIQFQAGAGDSGINLVSFLFLARSCFTLGETQRDLRFHRNVFLLPVIKHLILRVADHSLYTDVCADANLSTQKHRTLSIFTLSFIFYAILFYFPAQKKKN